MLLASILALLGASAAVAAPRVRPRAARHRTRPAASSTAAAPRVRLHAAFRPDRPGASTTISFGFSVAEPSPVRSIEVELPAGMGFATATLGFATCKPHLFIAEGAKGCPADSRVGHGRAYAEAPFTGEGGVPKPTFETARVETFFGPIEGGAQIVLFWIEGSSPASFWQPLIARALPARAPYGERLLIEEVPLLLAAPEGPFTALRGFSSTIGPQDITYYLHRHGRAIPFTPRGVSVPDRCPRGGYPVRASFTWWQSGERSHAITHVPCPRRRRGGHGRRSAHPRRRRSRAATSRSRSTRR